MKNLFTLLSAAVLCLGIGQPLRAQNKVINGSFEIRNYEPRGLANIAPGGDYDDLPNWTNIASTPDFMASTSQANFYVNTVQRDSYNPFYPQQGTGCVAVVNPGLGPQYFEYIGQRLSGLAVGNVYRVTYYVRQRPSSNYRARISLTVHPSQTAPPTRGQSGSFYGFTPAPVAAITSNYVTNYQNWTLVTGTFTAQSSTPWIVIGAEAVAPDYVDPSGSNPLYISPTFANDGTPCEYIDNVSVVDLGAGGVASISGPSTICNGQSTTFTANPAMSCVWGASPSSLFSTTSGYGSTFTPNLVANASGTGTITATFLNYPGGTVTVTKTVTVLPPCPDASGFGLGLIRGPHDCLGPRCYFDFNIVNPYGWPYRWSLYGTYNESAPSIAVGRTTTSPFVPFPNGVTTITVYCVFHDPSGCCDDVPVPYTIHYSGDPTNPRQAVPGAGGAPTSAYPNPSADHLELPVRATNAELLNSAGTVVLRGTGDSSLDLRSVKDGTYYLRTVVNGKTTTQRVEVKH